MLWFHPAVRVLISRISLAREMLVDQETIAHTGNRRAYAEALLAFANPQPRLIAATPFIRRFHHAKRVALITQEGSMSSRRATLIVAVASLAVVLATGAAIAQFPIGTAVSAQSTPEVFKPGDGVSLPRVLTEVRPQYTREAMDAKIQGTVLLTAVVLSSGDVGDVDVIRSLDDKYRPRPERCCSGKAVEIRGREERWKARSRRNHHRADLHAQGLTRKAALDAPPLVCNSESHSRRLPTGAGSSRISLTVTRMVSGRAFTDDNRQSTAAVALVNQTFARRFLGGKDPTRVEIAFGFPAVDPQTRRGVVGVVNDVKYASLTADLEPAVYLVLAQRPMSRQSIVVATSLRDAGVIGRGDPRGSQDDGRAAGDRARIRTGAPGIDDQSATARHEPDDGVWGDRADTRGDRNLRGDRLCVGRAARRGRHADGPRRDAVEHFLADGLVSGVGHALQGLADSATAGEASRRT